MDNRTSLTSLWGPSGCSLDKGPKLSTGAWEMVWYLSRYLHLRKEGTLELGGISSLSKSRLTGVLNSWRDFICITKGWDKEDIFWERRENSHHFLLDQQRNSFLLMVHLWSVPLWKTSSYPLWLVSIESPEEKGQAQGSLSATGLWFTVR